MNNRQFKFRIWLKGYNQFSYFDLAKFIDNCDGYAGNRKEDFVIQQFTGLLDKNGREIYEGDIFKDDNGETLIVKWAKIEYMGNQGFQFFRLDGSEYCFYGSMGNFDEKELVGNIFENPDLIKV